MNNNSITLNGKKVNDENMVINKDIAIEQELVIIRRGKKKYFMGQLKK